MSKRALAVTWANRTKLVSVLERLRARPALAVLVYHRILKPEGHPYDRDVIEATPDQFDDQIALLRKRYDVVPPAEMAEVVNHPERLRSFRVAVTFDDGYRDNYDVAFPILKSHGVGATFFLPTSFVGTRRLPWWDQIAFTVRSATRSEIALAYPKRVVVAIDPARPEAGIRAVIRAYTRSTDVELGRFLEEVERACDRPLTREVEERQFLTFEEAREMQRAGMGIGSHSHTHTVLGNMTAAEQEEECRESRARLEEHGIEPDALAYPVGGRTAFSETTIACAKKTGYRYAVSNYGGINVPGGMDAFDVRRLGMGMEEDAEHLRVRLAVARVRGKELW